jgi:hypothetical protein
VAAALLAMVLPGGAGAREAGSKETGAAKVLRVEQFGAVADGSSEAGPGIRAAIAAAIAAGPGAEVVRGPGRYRVKPAAGSTTCFPIEAAKGLVIRGAAGKTELILTNPQSGAFAVNASSGVYLKNLIIDHDPLPFTQGRIVGVDLEGGSFDLEIEPGFPLLSERGFAEASERHGKWGMVFERRRRRLKAGAPSHLFLASWSHLRDRVWRIWPREAERGGLRYLEVGDRFVQLARGYYAATAFYSSRDCGIENVTIHSSAGVAAVLVGNEGGITIRRLAVRFPVNSRRLLTTDADGVHCQQDRRGPLIEGCYFEGMADDGVNIYTPPNVVLEVRSPTQVATTPQGRIRPGDLLQIMDPRAGEVRAEVRASEVGWEQGRYLLALERAVPGIKAGGDFREADTIYNLSACGEGYVIRNNTLRNHRRHGLFLKGRNGLVEGNTFENLSGLGVVIANDSEWPEGPFPRDVTVRKNRFVGCGYSLGMADSPRGASLRVCGEKLRSEVANGRPVSGIVIEDNEFRDPLGAAIFVGAAREVRISGNRIEAAPGTKARRRAAAILVENCGGVVIENNEIRDARPERTAGIEISPSVDPGKTGVVIRGLKAKLAEGCAPVVDRREPEKKASPEER